MDKKISEKVINRLTLYHCILTDYIEQHIEYISSKQLAVLLKIDDSQVRKDISVLNNPGKSNVGYIVKELKSSIEKTLGFSKNKKAFIIGAGNLGRAVAAHMSFEERGFNLIGIFDRNEALAGQLVRGLPIRQISGLYDFCRENAPTVAVLCIPSESAAEVTQELVNLGVKGFWNFTHYDISANYPGVAVENVHLSDSLMTLSYHLNNL